MKLITGGVCAAKGFTAGGIHCGIRKNHTKKDLAMVLSSVPASAAAVYTPPATPTASRSRKRCAR